MALSILTGYFSCDELMKFSNSTKAGSTKAGRNLFLLQVYVLPVLMGFAIVFSLSTLYSFPLHLLGFVVFFLVGVGLFIRSELIKYGIKAHRTDILNINPIVPLVFITLIYGGVWYWFR